MELIVAEKPTVAKKIAAAIGERVEKKRFGVVSYYEVTRDSKKIVVAPAVGHIYTLAEKKKGHSYPVFDIEWVPAYEGDKSAFYTKPYLELLQRLGSEADTVVVACDYDIEGSLIGYNIFRFASNGKDGRRMKFSALTPYDLREAYENMTELDYANAYAGEARHILDWYYGINLSRALMASLKAAGKFKIMSIGRVQGPALAILCERELEIKDFVPLPYWDVSITVKGVTFFHTSNKFFDENEAQKAYDATSDNCRVVSVDTKELAVWPYPPFDLTSLQVEAYKLFGFSPSQTLELSQELYENSLISYPRTSSQKLPLKLNLRAIIERLASNPMYEKEAEKLIANNWFRPFEGKKEDPAHPAIHPTGFSGKMSEKGKMLYDLIVRRFLSVFAPKGLKLKTLVMVDSNGQTYTAEGEIMKEKGWTEIYGKYYRGEDKELPPFTVDENTEVQNKKKEKKMTQPPKRYTQASIVSELESRHLGTKATRSVIIDTLFKRGYVKGRSIEVTLFGLSVYGVLKKYAPEILDEALTRQIEEDMEKIQEGKQDKEFVINEGKDVLLKIVEKFKQNEENIGSELAETLKITEEKENNVGVCNFCSSTLRIIRLKDGRQFIGCANYPKCKNSYPLPSYAYVTPAGRQCEICGLPMVFVKMAKRRRFAMCINANCESKKKWAVKKEEKVMNKRGERSKKKPQERK